MLSTIIGEVASRRCQRSNLIKKTSHEPLGFLSGTFRGSQQRWATVDRKEFAILSMLLNLEYLAAIKVSRGVRRARHFCSEESDSPCQR